MATNYSTYLKDTMSGNITGSSGTTTKLSTARTIGVSGVTGTAQAFDGSKNIVIPITSVPANLISGAVASATKLQTARTINGVAFDGTKDITIPTGGASGSGVPIGTIVEFGSSTIIPEGWMICDGRAISRTTYSDLFAVIGTTFGTGDGTATFNLPDFRSRIPVGYNNSDTDFNAIGKKGGSKTKTLSIDNVPSHTHTFTANAHAHGLNSHTHSVPAHSHGLNSHTHSFSATTKSSGAHTHTANSAGAHTHKGRYLDMDVTRGGVGSYLIRRVHDDDSYKGTGQVALSAGAHTHSTTSNGAHTHSVSGTTGKASGSTANSSTLTSGAASGNTTNTTITGTNSSVGKGASFTLLNPYITVVYIIKAKEVNSINTSSLVNTANETSTLDVESLLQNEWITNGMCQIFKTNNIVYINLAVRNGTSEVVLNLPEEFRPKSPLMRTVTYVTNTPPSNSGYVYVGDDGELSFKGVTISTGITFLTNIVFLKED